MTSSNALDQFRDTCSGGLCFTVDTHGLSGYSLCTVANMSAIIQFSVLQPSVVLMCVIKKFLVFGRRR